MKKTMGLLIGVVALLVVAVPAMARTQNQSRPETSSLTNMVMIDNESSAMANTGMNRLSGSGTLRTGDAYADSLNLNTVNIGVAGCCEENDGPSCCHQRDRRCGCQETQEPSTQVMNMVVLSNRSMAGANTGLNLLTGTSQTQKPSCRDRHHPVVSTGTLSTGAASALSGNSSVVNLSVTGF